MAPNYMMLLQKRQRIKEEVWGAGGGEVPETRGKVAAAESCFSGWGEFPSIGARLDDVGGS